MNGLISFVNYNIKDKAGSAQISNLQFRRDTAANWTLSDPILYSGEIGIETDTSQIKIGVNTNLKWSQLEYFTGGSEAHGFLLPRLTTAEGEAIIPQTEGLMYYNTEQHRPYVHEGSDIGWVGLQRQLSGTTNQITVGESAISITDPFNIGVINAGANTDTYSSIGRAKIGGDSGTTDIAFFSHYDMNGISPGNINVAIAQNALGVTTINAPTGQTVSLAINGSNKVTVNADGSVTFTGSISASSFGSVVGDIFYTRSGDFEIAAETPGVPVVVQIDRVSSLTTYLLSYYMTGNNSNVCGCSFVMYSGANTRCAFVEIDKRQYGSGANIVLTTEDGGSQWGYSVGNDDLIVTFTPKDGTAYSCAWRMTRLS